VSHEVGESVLGDCERGWGEECCDRGQRVQVDGDVSLHMGVVPWWVGNVLCLVRINKAVGEVEGGSEVSVSGWE
jgi:hypothetical protein